MNATETRSMTTTSSDEITTPFNNLSVGQPFDSTWKTALIAGEIVVIAIAAVTTWISLSMIVFGTKTRRWTKNRGTSSLNSGMIYTTSFIAITFTLTKLAATLVYFHAPMSQIADFPCELLLDIMSAVYFCEIFLMYVVLWMVQRRIYTHPSVKSHVSSFMNQLSKYSLIPIAIAFVVIAVVYGLTVHSEYQPLKGCMVKHEAQKSRLYHSIACGVVGLMIQGLILALCIYPAVKARFPIRSQDGELVAHDKENVAKATQRINYWKLCCFKERGVSPIQSTVNRTVTSTLIIVITDILATLVESFMITKTKPVVLHTILYDANAFINVIALLYIFGFAAKVLTLFCPTCPHSIVTSKSKTCEYKCKISEI